MRSTPAPLGIRSLCCTFKTISMRMKEDARLTFRVRSDLKKEVEAIAAREGQSAARICEAFLSAGSDAYKKTQLDCRG